MGRQEGCRPIREGSDGWDSCVVVWGCPTCTIDLSGCVSARIAHNKLILALKQSQ